MPFKSEKQRRWLFLHHPRIARRFAKHTPKGTKLPKYVKHRKSRRRRKRR